MNIEFVSFRHSELSEEYLDEMIRLKQQHWPHPYESQRRWVKENLEEGDIHLFMKLDGAAVAYLSINFVGVNIDGRELILPGLGNVCVDLGYQKQGLGSKIVARATQIIDEMGQGGILLCHSHLIKFYGGCGWRQLSYGKASVGGRVFDDIVMLYGSDVENASSIKIQRNF